MPKRKLTARKHRLSDQKLANLQEIIASGAPWQKGSGHRGEGSWDIFGLVRGHFYDFGLKFCREHEPDTHRALWELLRDDILREHIAREPGTRPAAWWLFDAPELRQVVGLDRAIVGDETDRLPAGEDPNLPEWARGKTYFGRPSIIDGFEYESQCDFLERLSLLTDHERKIFMETPMGNQNEKSSYRQNHIDCGCGEKYLVVDIMRSNPAPTGLDRRLLKRKSKKIGRHFAESTDGFYTCPKCKGKVDLSAADEKYDLNSSTPADEIPNMMRRTI